MSLQRAFLQSLLFLSLSGLARPDRIILADGKEIADVKVVSESLSVVTYKSDKKEKTIPSDKVRTVEFERLPKLVDEAMAALQGGDAGAAADMLAEYVAKRAEKGDRNYPWGPAFAAWKGIELRQQFGDLAGVIEQAKSFANLFPESRYLPLAYMARLAAEHQAEDSAALTRTLADFRSLIERRSLSERWSLEADLMEARSTSGSLAKRRAALEAVAAKAKGSYPGVASRAEAAVGEALLAEAEKNVADQAKASSLRDEARKLFEEIIVDESADSQTLAAAYTGLGECLFYAGADKQDTELLGKAVRALLRVPVLFESESAYVPRALYLAGRTFDMLQDKKRKNDMRRELERNYPNSPWTEEARRVF